MHLRQIGLALHKYHETYTLLPPGGVFDSAGTGYVGWPMSILPFILMANGRVVWLSKQIDPAVFRAL